MSWVDQLQPASFRGVPFHVDDISQQFGQTVVVREYPFQDLPTVFSMGDGAEEIAFSAYVIGDDYIDQRDALREVLSGEGVLVHPTAGSIRVYVVGRIALRENPTYEGGVARFDLTFMRAEKRRYPVGVDNTEGQAAEAADAAGVAAQDQFASDFSLDGAPGWVAERAGAHLGDVVDSVWGQVGGVLSSLGGADFVSDMIGGYQQLRGNFTDLLGQPGGLAAGIAGLFGLPLDMTAAQVQRYQAAFLSLFDMSAVVVQRDFEVAVMPAVGAGLVLFGTGRADALVTASPARTRLTQLTAASNQLVETLATAAYVRATAALEFGQDDGTVILQRGGSTAPAANPASSYDGVMTMRSALHAQCVRLLVDGSRQAAPAALPAAAWHDAVSAMHTAALRDLQARSRDLVRMTTYTPQACQPVWYVSHLLYGTATYADEIMALNPHIRHPLLVPPGRPLRVLRHD